MKSKCMGCLFLLFSLALAYQPPINVIIDVHIEPFETEIGDTVSYPTRLRGLCWLRDTAAWFGAPLSVQSSGEFMEYVADSGDYDEIMRIIELGGDVGTHTHPNYWRYGRHDWRLFAPVEYIYSAPPETVWGVIMANKSCVDSVIGAENNRTLAPFFREYLPEIMDSLGFYQICIMEMNQEIEAESVLMHYPWNPWQVRVDPLDLEDMLREDFDQPYVQIPLLPEAHPWSPTDPPFWKRRFIMLYIEWLAQIRHGDYDKVWVISWLAHPRAILYRTDDHIDILKWLTDNFVGKTTPTGDTIAKFSTASEVALQYYSWRSEHPGLSSFNFSPGGEYPYTYQTMRYFLWGSTYDTTVHLGDDIECFRFIRRDEYMVPRDTIWVLWHWFGDDTIDFCLEHDGYLLTDNGVGDTIIRHCGEIPICPEPLFVVPFDTTGAVAESRRLWGKPLLSTFPNPFVLGCRMEVFAPAPATVEIISADGRILWRKKVAPGRSAISVDATGWKPGVYIAKLSAFGRTMDTEKLLLIR